MRFIISLISGRCGRLIGGFTAVCLTCTALTDAAPGLADVSSVTRTIAGERCVPQWDTAIGDPGMNNWVMALTTLPNGDLVAGGTFTMAGGNPANRIARWDGSQWHAMGSGFDQSYVWALALLPDGDLIAAGGFTSAGGVPMNKIARWDGTDWHPLGLGITDGGPHCLLVLDNGDLIVGGLFNTAGDEPAKNVARWDGSQWHAMGEGIPSLAQITSLALFDDGSGEMVYAGGGVNQIPGLHRWNGTSWSVVDAGLLVHDVIAMAVADDGSGPALFVAAGLRVAEPGQMSEMRLSFSAKYGASGGQGGPGWEPLDMQPIGRGSAIFDDGGGPALYWGTSGGLVKWDGFWWLPVAEGLNGTVFAMTVFDDGSGPSLYVAGSFTSANGEPAYRIVRLQHCPPAPPVTHHVPGDFSTIQAAIDAASDGEVVVVGPGTYNEAINLLGKTIIVESESGPEATIIDATGLNAPAVTVPSGSHVGTTLRGFTVTGSAVQGVLLQASTLAIDHCIVVDNENLVDLAGGGILAWGGELLVDNSIVAANLADFGAGVRLNNSQVRFRDSVFRDNVAHAAGAVSISASAAAFLRCTIQDNVARLVEPWNNPWGGGVTVGGHGSQSYPCYFKDTDFIGNTAEYVAGALGSNLNASLSINDCRFVQNEAKEYGGGIFFQHETLTRWVKDTFFCENQPDHITGAYTDGGGNVFEDVCDPLPGDLNGDGVVDVSDLLIMLVAWGTCADPSNCPADLNGDGAVDVSDVLILLANWG